MMPFTAMRLRQPQTGGGDIFSKTIAQLHFDGSNGQTTVVESTGRSSWTLNNSALSTDFSVFGPSSLKTNAGNAQTTGIGIQGGEDFTVEGWIRPMSLRFGGVFVLNSGSGTYGQMRVDVAANGTFSLLICRFDDPGSWDTVSANLGSYTPGVTYHVRVTKKGTTYKLFVNGTSVSTVTGPSQPFYAISAPTWLGQLTNGNFFFDGYFDEWRFVKGLAVDNGENFVVPTSPFPDS